MHPQSMCDINILTKCIIYNVMDHQAMIAMIIILTIIILAYIQSLAAAVCEAIQSLYIIIIIISY